MFSKIFITLQQGELPDLALLQRHFDLAMTKKLGVVKLPPAFWMQDSKINPRSDHLLQAALLLGDRERCDMALSVLAVEAAEKNNEHALEEMVCEIIAALIKVLPQQEKKQMAVLAEAICPDCIKNAS